MHSIAPASVRRSLRGAFPRSSPKHSVSKCAATRRPMDRLRCTTVIHDHLFSSTTCFYQPRALIGRLLSLVPASSSIRLHQQLTLVFKSPGLPKLFCRSLWRGYGGVRFRMTIICTDRADNTTRVFVANCTARKAKSVGKPVLRKIFQSVNLRGRHAVPTGQSIAGKRCNQSQLQHKTQVKYPATTIHAQSGAIRHHLQQLLSA